jgi:ABC-2 type transport system permease protein
MLTILYRRLWMQSQSYKIMLIMTGLTLVINFAFGGMNQNYVPTLEVVDLDQTVVSQEFIQRLEAIPDQKVVVSDTFNERRVQMGVPAALIIHEDFSGAIMRDESPRLELVSLKADAEVQAIRYNIEQTYSEYMTYRNLAVQFENAVTASGSAYTRPYEVMYGRLVEVNQSRETIQILTVSDTKRDLSQEIALYRILGFVIMFTAFTTVFATADIVEEKRYYTWQRTLVAPVSKLGIVSGHVAVAFVIGMMQWVFTLVAGQWWFGIDYGTNFLGLLTVGALYVLTMAAFGLVIASSAMSPNALGGIMSIALTSMAMLGGCMWPLDMVSSKILIALSWFTPHRWAFDALRAIGTSGATLASQSFELMILGGMAILMMGAGILRLRGDN